MAKDEAEALAAGRAVRGRINYLGDMAEKPRFHAQEHARDNIAYAPREVTIWNGRAMAEAPSLQREGVTLAAHPTAVRDFEDAEEVAAVYGGEVESLLLELTGARRVTVLKQALVRYANRSPRYKTGVNSQPARFPHLDFSAATAPGLTANAAFGAAAVRLRPGERLVGYNVWRVISQPPQDTPLAVCDQRSIAAGDLALADGVYDHGPEPWPTMEAYMLRPNPDHRWIYFRDMRPDEALVFKGYEAGAGWTTGAAHSAFDDPSCPEDAPARISLETRAFAVF